MLHKPKCPVIAIEEHYWDAEMAAHFTGVEAGRPGETQRRLDDLRNAVHDIAAKEKQLAGAKFHRLASVHDELPSP